LGAEVFKIESPRHPDGSKAMGDAYTYLNRGKKIVTLDLTDPKDRGAFHERVRGAHGLIEAFRPQAKAKLGLDEKSLLGVNPKLCIGSLVGYPEHGPWRDRAGHNLNFEAVAGTISMFKEMPTLPLADLFAAYTAALRLTAAMDQAERTGRGSRQVVSMSRVLAEMQGLWVHEFHKTGQAPLPGTTLMSGQNPCYRLYTAGCGRRVAVAAIEHKFWVKVCGILGLNDHVGHGLARGEQARRTIEAVQATLGEKPWSHWAPLFEGADCCVEPVATYEEAYGPGLRPW
jgi:crotonobetainyl-CoA:carnitine CoA-transferase CaiB-like acyl-CoA transferase